MYQVEWEGGWGGGARQMMVGDRPEIVLACTQSTYTLILGVLAV